MEEKSQHAGEPRAENLENGVLCSKRLNNYTFKTCKILFTLLIGHTQTNFQHAITRGARYIQPHTSFWAIKKIHKFYPLLTVQYSAVETKLLVLIVKTSCKNSILPGQNSSLHEQCRARFKERNQNSETSNFAFALRIISTGKCCKWYRKLMQKYYFKETELYLCSFPSHVFFGKGQKIVFAFNQNRSWNISRYACQKWKWDRWKHFHLTWQNIDIVILYLRQ